MVMMIQLGKPEQWGDWQEMIQDNITSVLAYVKINDYLMEDIEEKIEEIFGD